MGYKHKEAFAVMNYECECGHRELIWNSRDGVTPFTVPCPVCKDAMGLCHVNFNMDKVAILYQVPKNSRYFASMTIEQARTLAAKNVDCLISIGRIRETERNQRIREFTTDYYQNGESPILLVKE